MDHSFIGHHGVSSESFAVVFLIIGSIVLPSLHAGLLELQLSNAVSMQSGTFSSLDPTVPRNSFLLQLSQAMLLGCPLLLCLEPVTCARNRSIVPPRALVRVPHTLHQQQQRRQPRLQPQLRHQH